MRRNFIHVMFVLAGSSLVGCSEMRFAGKDDVRPANDTREDVRLTGVNADLTSGGKTLQRVGGDRAVFSQNQNLLRINEVEVEMVGDAGKTEGVTEAKVAEIYLADAPDKSRKRSDMEFSGGVVYRSPQPGNPEEDTLRLNTEQLLFENASGLFRSNTSHTITMLPPSKKPIFMTGKAFTATRDLTRFDVQAGAIVPEQDAGSQTAYKDVLSSLTSTAEQVESEAGTTSNRPQLIVAPATLAPPERPVLPAVPKLEQPPQSPTRIQVPARETPPQRPPAPQLPEPAAPPTPTPPPGILKRGA